MKPETIGVLGARSLVGDCLLEILPVAGFKISAVSRQAIVSTSPQIEWQQWPEDTKEQAVSHWISALPIWILPQFFPFLEQRGCRRIVALSSTSRFVKADSADREEKVVATALAQGEAELQAWAEQNRVRWTILRPTLIYGLGQDKNIAEIVRLIQRFGFFPLTAKGCGLRQPIHAEDVATACLQALDCETSHHRAYNISGGSTLAYRGMVDTIFQALHKPARFFPLPLWLAKIFIAFAHSKPAYRQWTVSMFKRMGQDLVFDHDEATKDFGFSPRTFQLRPEDLPQ